MRASLLEKNYWRQGKKISNPNSEISDKYFNIHRQQYNNHLANVPYIILGVFKQNLTLQDLQDAYAMGVSHEIAEMVVDPTVDHINPEVCDPCDLNCRVLYRNYFDVNNQYISTTRNGLPPGFDYMYYICGIVRASSATMCPAPDSACNYGPPP